MAPVIKIGGDVSMAGRVDISRYAKEIDGSIVFALFYPAVSIKQELNHEAASRINCLWWALLLIR